MSVVCIILVVLSLLYSYSRSGRQIIDNRVQSGVLPSSTAVSVSSHYSISARSDGNGTPEFTLQLPKDFHCHSVSVSSNSSLFTYLVPMLAEYQEKHRIWRNRLLMGDPSVRTLTWYCNRVCGGIGDRVRGLLLSLLLAVVSERLFLVQWTQPFFSECQTDIFEPAAINWNIDRQLVTKIDQLPHQTLWLMSSLNSKLILKIIQTHVPSIQDKHLKIKTNLQLGYRYFSHFGNYTKRKLHGKPLEDILKYITAPGHQALVKSVLARYLLAFSTPVIEKAKKLSSEMRITQEQKFAAVHIRAGFFGILNETRPSFQYHRKTSTWRLLLDCAINKSRILGTHVPIVLFTDSPVVKSWATENYKARIVAIPGVAVHIDKMNKRGNMTLQEVATGAELVIMSHASLLVQGYRSGFSTVALEMCPIPDSNTFNIQKCTRAQ